jgi:uncharacterized damage-inducible protein DinB
MENPEEMNKDRFLHLVRTERTMWEEILSQVPQDRMSEPGVAGDGEWSVKDIIVHISWYEREMIGVLKNRKLVGSDLWQKSTDDRNAILYEQNKDRSLDAVLEDERRTFASLLPLLEALTETDLHDPNQFDYMPLEWVPWKIFADNTFEHYQHHRPQIEAWLSRGK